MRITAADYRGWTLVDWCRLVMHLGVTSLTEWSRASHYSYRIALAHGVHREVAESLNWLPRLANGALARMTDEDFARRFAALGVKTISDMWRAQQPWCEHLRRHGRFEAVTAQLGIDYLHEYHPVDLDYYVARCRAVGYYEAWCQVDRNAAETARKHGLIHAVQRLCPGRPAAGFETLGGRCQTLPELAVARVLEHAGVPFTTQPEYPFHFSERRYHFCRADFVLPQHGALYVEVWGATCDDRTDRMQRYLRRRADKVRRCAELGLPLLEVEGRFLFRHRLPAFMEYLAGQFEAAGVTIARLPEPRQALALESAGEVAGDGPGGINEVRPVD